MITIRIRSGSHGSARHFYRGVMTRQLEFGGDPDYDKDHKNDN